MIGERKEWYLATRYSSYLRNIIENHTFGTSAYFWIGNYNYSHSKSETVANLQSTLYVSQLNPHITFLSKSDTISLTQKLSSSSKIKQKLKTAVWMQLR